jgi:hypothetical protein
VANRRVTGIQVFVVNELNSDNAAKSLNFYEQVLLSCVSSGHEIMYVGM